MRPLNTFTLPVGMMFSFVSRGDQRDMAVPSAHGTQLQPTASPSTSGWDFCAKPQCPLMRHFPMNSLPWYPKDRVLVRPECVTMATSLPRKALAVSSVKSGSQPWGPGCSLCLPILSSLEFSLLLTHHPSSSNPLL